VQEVCRREVQNAIELAQNGVLNILAIQVFLLLKLHFLHLSEDLFVNLNAVKKDREDSVAFVNAQVRLRVRNWNLMPAINSSENLLHREQVHF